MPEKSRKAPKGERSVACVPWPKWSVEELKQEKWAEPKNGPDGLFMDTEAVRLPMSLQEEKRIRVRDLNHHLSEPPVLFHTTTEPVDLTHEDNKHLLVSEFMRAFISTVVYLLRRGFDDPAVRGNSGDSRWNARTFVHGLNKLSKAGEYRSTINPHGKYVVRVFFMGCWRRIVVDDVVPIDKLGRPLLPRTGKVLEIWPMLLAKAMLKIASLTWTERREILDFHPAASLTGWICLSFDVARLSPDDKWDFLMDHRFERTLRQEKATREAGFGAREEKIESPVKRADPIGACLLLDEVENLPIFVGGVRRASNDSENTHAPLASWKSYRWTKWAFARGLADPLEFLPPARCVEIVGPTAFDGSPPSANEGFRESAGGLWADFNGIAAHVRVIQLFYEATDFRHSATVSDHLPPETDALSGLSSAKRSAPTMTYNWPHPIRRTRNEPLYLLCDSTDDKLLLISFSSFQRDVATGKLEGSNLIVERHSWFLGAGSDEPLASIVTPGNRSVLLELEAGRHLLRLFCAAESCVCVAIFSDTVFQLGDRADMYKAMSSESERIRSIGKRISDSMRRAFESFGTTHHRDALKDYYRSYMPSEGGRRLSKEYRSPLNRMHLYFAEELAREIRNAGEIDSAAGFEATAFSLRVFFLDPKIGRDSVTEVSREARTSQTAEEFPARRRAATIIQSFFRMILIKRYMCRHKGTRGDRDEIRNRLLEAANLFDHAKEDSPIYRVIRNSRKRLEMFDQVYPFSADFQYVLRCQEYRGESLNVAPGEWQPLVRLRLNVPQGETLAAVFTLFTNLSNYVCGLRVFGSESGREVFRVANNAAAFRYRRRPPDTGFVIFGSGCSVNRSSSQLQWSLQIITTKDEAATFRRENEYPRELRNFVIRQVSNVADVADAADAADAARRKKLISRCIVRTKARKAAVVVVSLRLRVSCDDVGVRARLQLTDWRDDEPFAQADGTYILVLPFARLKEGTEQVRAEAFVFDESCLLKSEVKAAPARWSLQAAVAADGTDLELVEEKTRETERSERRTLERGKTLRELFRGRHSLSSLPGSGEERPAGEGRQLKGEDAVSTARTKRIAQRIDEEDNHAAFRDNLFEVTNSREYEYDDFCRNYVERLYERRALLTDLYKHRRSAFTGGSKFGSAPNRDKGRKLKAKEKAEGNRRELL